MTSLVIVGAGGHGKVVADCAQQTGRYDRIVFLDQGFPSHQRQGAWQVVGTPSAFANWQLPDTEFFVAIGNNAGRQQWHEMLKTGGASIATLVHPAATLSPYVTLGEGSLVMPGAVINADVSLGRGVIINTSASVDHDCNIGDFVHIAPGCHLAGNVQVGTLAFMGVGCSVIPGIKIGAQGVVGAGSTVIRDVNADCTVAGCPAKPL
ncbi:acetyltransferase [Aestuariibacter halophilus]|uniref:Acetyltransferase n=1 Tax=Fluctibacter halophilus TaxID=226011 RepID=A0ABS8GD77_9ALTE|nr:acetyltransferase [Aestuariibacter halophilus]MCC2618333.1 acetyltransferase [Aestuariibacter halophilus]